MPSISQWLHGGELLFITGSSFVTDEHTLMTLIHESVEEKLAGIVLLTGGESKLVITDSIREYADEHEFPLFEMPWDLKLVDVIQEISEMIISRKELGDTKQRFFYELLFSAEHPRKFEELASLYDIPSKKLISVAILHVLDNTSLNLSDLMHKLTYHQSIHCNLSGVSLIYAKHLGNVACLVMADSEKLMRKILDSLEHFVSVYAENYFSSGSVKLAVSSVAPNTHSVQSLYSEATTALRVITRAHVGGNHIYYDDLGIYKMFFYTPEEVRGAFCREHLEAIVQEDRATNSTLLETLRCYLMNGCNAIAAAQQLFIHKNTLNYRLNRIRSILNADLNDPAVRNNLYNALLIYDVFLDAFNP